MARKGGICDRILTQFPSHPSFRGGWGRRSFQIKTAPNWRCGCSEITGKLSLEAGTGIEPVFTDLQSNIFQSKNNALGQNSYQDKAGTPSEHDTAQNSESDAPKTKNPDALAGAIGADLKKQASGKIGTSRSVEYSLRTKRATALCEAIREAHPDDARQVLTAALADLEAGKPKPSRQDKVREDAKWWASMATPLELMEYTRATLAQLGEVALLRNHRKQLFARLWRQFSLEDQVAFLTKIKGGDL